MKRRYLLYTIAGALVAAPQPRLAEPRIEKGVLRWFTLAESAAEVERSIGAPLIVADFGEDYRSWHYRLGGVELHDYSHYLVFRRSTGRLISVTRSYDPEQKIDALFPARETKVVFAEAEGATRYGARVRRLPGKVLLIAMGSTHMGQPTGQLALVRESDVNHFFPWVASGLALPEAASPR